MGMTAHEYLSLYLALNDDIARWQRQRANRAKDCGFDYSDTHGLEPLLRATANYSGMPAAHTQNDRMAEVVGNKVDKELKKHFERYEDRITAALARQLEIEAAIDLVPLNLCRQALDAKYLQGLTLDEICDKMRSSKNTVRMIIKRGLSWIEVPWEAEVERLGED